MTTTTSASLRTTNFALYAGWVLSALVILFLLFDGIIKLIPLDVVLETLGSLGYPQDAGIARVLGVLTLLCTVLYAIPRTSFLGAVLLTGLLGGAMATHLRIASPLFSHTLFGLYLGIMVWGGLFLRSPKIRSLFMFQG
jgi:hypothetical protein